MAKLWCLLAMEKLHVSAFSGHLQVLTTLLQKEFYIILYYKYNVTLYIKYV